jgi:hypothetical protein
MQPAGGVGRRSRSGRRIRRGGVTPVPTVHVRLYGAGRVRPLSDTLAELLPNGDVASLLRAGDSDAPATD